MKEAFFYKDHNDTSVYHPTSFARGPWSPKTLHGRVLSGLIAYEVETNCLSEEEIDDFQATRMTIDLFRPPPMSALTLSSKIIRSGKRIKVIDVNIAATLEDRGVVDIARGNIVLLKRSANPEGEIWTPPAWEISPPAEDRPFPETIENESGDGKYLPIWETVNVSEEGETIYDHKYPIYRGFGIRRAWVRETHSFMSDESTSQLVRVAQVSDFANGFTNSGTEGLNYINADVTLYLHRMPVGSWIGTETAYQGGDNGVSVASMALYDKLGRIGTSTVCGLAQSRA